MICQNVKTKIPKIAISAPLKNCDTLLFFHSVNYLHSAILIVLNCIVSSSVGVSKLQTIAFQEVQDFPGISSFDLTSSPEFMTAMSAGPSLSHVVTKEKCRAFQLLLFKENRR